MTNTETLEQITRRIVEGFHPQRLILFGSRARGDERRDSDVDLLVEFQETPGLGEYMRFKFWLEERLGQPVDLVMKGALKEWAQPTVEAEAIRVA